MALSRLFDSTRKTTVSVQNEDKKRASKSKEKEQEDDTDSSSLHEEILTVFGDIETFFKLVKLSASDNIKRK